MALPLGNGSPSDPFGAAEWLLPKGDVADRLQAIHWLEHPLGVPGSWPFSVRVLLNLALSSPQPVFLFWGPRYFAFFNDPARALLGEQGYDGAGCPAAEGLSGFWPSVADAVVRAATSSATVSTPAFRLQNSAGEEFWSFTAIHILLEGSEVLVWCQGSNETERIRAGRRPPRLRNDLLEDSSAHDPNVLTGRRIGFALGQGSSTPARFGQVEGQGSLLWAESMAIGICIARVDGSFEYVNGVLAHYAGEPAEALLNAGWNRLIHPEELFTILGRWSCCLTTGKIFETEMRLRRYDGIYRWFVWRIVPLRDTEGRIIRWLGTVIDIDDLKKAQQALAQAEHEYRILTESAPQFIWRAGPDGSVEFVNRVWREYTGVDFQRDEDWTTAIYPDDVPRALEAWARHSADGTPYEVEYRVRNAANGEYRWFLARMTPYRDENGRIAMWLGFAIDVHERKGAEAELSAARAAAEAANNTKDQFLATLSHELRTPLNAILGWTQLIKMTLPESEQHSTLQEGLEVIERNTLAQVQLVEDLLDVSRIVSGQMRLEHVEVNLTEVVKAATDSVRPYAQSGDVHLREEFAPGFLVVVGDGSRLQQVIWNLLTNAIKFSEPGSTVQVRTWREEVHAFIEVIDQGRGIPPESLARLFEPFFQVDRSKALSHRGLGLGLAIVHSLVQLHGGTVRAFSEGIGRGSIFQVQLPLSAESHSGIGPTIRQQKTVLDQLAARQALQGLHLLIVDDEPDGREVLRSVLQYCGADVITVSSGPEAIVAARASLPDLLICDIYMPGMDGYTTLENLHALAADQGNRLPAIALTAFARADDRIRALQSGFQRHLAKPVDYTELVRNILELVARS
jgi:PAS domain S-box-containing protein